MKAMRRKVLALFMAVAVALPGGIIPVNAEEAVAANAEETKTIQILQTSDLHGKFVPFKYATYEEDKSGSLAQIATVIKERKNDDTILIDVGDTIQDNSAELFLEDDIHPMMVGFNALKYDFWCVGNHEFNFGVDTLKRVVNQFEGTTFIGNVYDKDGETKLGDDYEIVEKDGVKVAVIGMVTPNITKWDTENLTGYTVTNPMDETKAIVEKVKDDVDVIVVACHMDLENEFGVSGSGAYDLAKACPDVDVILAAHGHQNVVEYVNDNNTLIAENLNSGQTMNDIDITVKSDGNGGYEIVDGGIKCETISMKNVEADAEISEALEPFNERAKEDALTFIGKLVNGDLVNPTEITGVTQSQIEESAMMNLINDVQLYYANQGCSEDERAIVSAAAVFSANANIKEGDIKKCDSALIYKFDNTIYKLRLTGKQLKQYMEWSASYYNTYKAGDLTISFDENVRSYLYDIFGGVRYEINISKEPGNRIENLCYLDGNPIKETDTVILAANNYRSASQLTSDGVVFNTANGDTLPEIIEKNCYAGACVRDLIAKYIQEVKGGTISPVYYNTWKVTGTDWDVAKHNKAAQLVNAGIIEIPKSADGRTDNVKSVTESDLKAYLSAKQAKITKVTAKSNSMTVTYDKIATADGYKVSYSTDKNFKSGVKSKTTTKNSISLTGLSTNKKYYVKVVAYYKGDKSNIYGKESAVKTVALAKTELAKGKISKITAAKKSAKVTITKVSNATGYKVTYSTDKKFKKSVKTTKTTKTSVTISKLTSKKTYYFKVQAYAKDANGKTYYGKESAVKSVKIK